MAIGTGLLTADKPLTGIAMEVYYERQPTKGNGKYKCT
jgi:hypothetical protein